MNHRWISSEEREKDVFGPKKFPKFLAYKFKQNKQIIFQFVTVNHRKYKLPLNYRRLFPKIEEVQQSMFILFCFGLACVSAISNICFKSSKPPLSGRKKKAQDNNRERESHEKKVSEEFENK
jgi:hypothetical protein